MIPVSGHKIMVAPGKSRMDDSGIAFCYVYVIQNSKVICKLGVYEKKSDTMPLLFDISTFPEGAFRLFEEFEKNPSKLIDIEMKEEPETTVFDFLVKVYSKIEDKKIRVNNAYKTLYKLFEKSKDTEMKPIIKIISVARKEDEPDFLQKLNEEAKNTTLFVYTLLALQYIFQVEFFFKTEDEKYNEMKKSWPIETEDILWVDLETRELIEAPKDESVKAPDTKLDSVEASEEASEDASEISESEKEPIFEPAEPEKMDTIEEEMNVNLDESIKAPDTKLDESIKAPDTKLDESIEPDTKLDESIELVPEPVKTVKKSRKTTPKEKKSEEKEEPKEETVKKTRKPRTPKAIGTSLNTKIKAPRKIKLKESESK
jgi:hypothetical protein